MIQDNSHGSSKEPMNLWPERIHPFLWCTSDLGSLILIQLTPKKYTLYLYWTFCWKKPPCKIVNHIGSKIISNVNKHYLTYDSLKYCLCSDIVMCLSFFPKFFHLQPHSHLPQLNFSLFFFIKNMTLWYFTCIYCQLLFFHNISPFLVA